MMWFRLRDIIIIIVSGDDVINEFLQDKQEDIEDDKPKAIDTSLPGTVRYNMQPIFCNKDTSIIRTFSRVSTTTFLYNPTY